MARRDTDPTEQALEEIREAKAAGQTKLSIRATTPEVVRAACEITTLTDLRISGEPGALPDEIGDLVELESLRIEQNELRALPRTIGRLTKLRDLCCYSNKLTALPEELGSMVSLRELTLWSNELETLPSTIGRLTSLTKLELKWNKLRELPDSIAELVSLEELDLEDNELVRLPSSLAGMKKLRRLLVSDNNLTEFPRGVLELPVLRELDLSENQIEAIPDDISRLTRLEELLLADNRIERLPSGLFALPSLAKLDLKSNRIQAIDAGIGQLASLAELELEDNPIEGVPEELLEKGMEAIFEHLGLTEPTVLEGDLPPESERAAIVEARQAAIDQFVRDVDGSNEDMLPQLVDFLVGKTNVMPPARRGDHSDFESLPKHLAKVEDWTFIDHRILRYISGRAWYYRQPGHDYYKGYHDELCGWLRPQLQAETGEGVFARVAEGLRAAGLDDQQILRGTLRELAKVIAVNDVPTSYGRWLLGQVATQLDAIREVSEQRNAVRDAVVGLLVRHAPEAFAQISDALLALDEESSEVHVPHGAYEQLCAADPVRYTPMVLDALERTGCTQCRAELAKVLAERCGEAHRERAFELAMQTLGEVSKLRNTQERLWFLFNGRSGDAVPAFVEWVLATFGQRAKEAVFAFVEGTKVFDLEIAGSIARHLGQDGVDALAEGLNMKVDADDFAPHFRQVFALLPPFDWSKYHDKAWELARSEHRQVRNTAAFALSRLDPAAVLPRALEMMSDRTDHVREGGVMIATLLPGDPAKQRLDELLASERNDEVRDLIVAQRHGREGSVTASEIAQRVASAEARGKLARPVAKWIDEAKLPPVYWKDGGQVDPATLRFLFHRQTRLSEIATEPEARAVYAAIDRERSAPFATELLAQMMKKGGVAAKNRFALSVMGMVGGDDLVAPLEELAIDARNENAVATLGLLGSLAAGRALDRVLRAYRTKYPNVREAAQEAFDLIAETLGMTRFELGDAMIPDLGFVNGEGVMTLGKVSARVLLGADRKLSFLDAKGKPIKTPSKGLTGKSKAAFEALKDELDVSSRALSASLEYSLVSGRRWLPAKWEAFFLGNPIAFAFARSLVWTAGDQTFRVEADRRLVDVGGAEVVLGSAPVALVHPLEVAPAVRDGWIAALDAAGLAPPFRQLRRPVFAPGDPAQTLSYEFERRRVQGPTFKARAEHLGWRRGSVNDGGEVSAYRRTFDRYGIDAFIKLKGLGVRADDGDKITLAELFFVKTGAVVTGRYTYDEPRNAADPRLIALGAVPAIVYSETIADLQVVAPEPARTA